MAANPDDLTTIRDSLIAELKGETSRRAALVAQGLPPPITYSSGGKSVSWTEYVQAMQALIKEQNELVIAAGGDGGLYEVIFRGYT